MTGQINVKKLITEFLQTGLVIAIISLISCELPTPNDPTDDKGFVTYGSYPNWSPVSNEFAFEKNDSIYIHDLDNGKERLVLINGKYPYFSPDGLGIAFTRGDSIWIKYIGSIIEIFVTIGSTPAWSADGQKLAFTLTRNQKQIIMDIEDSNLCVSDTCVHYYDLSLNRIVTIEMDTLPVSYFGNDYGITDLEWGLEDSILFFSSNSILGKIEVHTGHTVFEDIVFDYDDRLGRPIAWNDGNGILLYTYNYCDTPGCSGRLQLRDRDFNFVPNGSGLNDYYYPSWSNDGERFVAMISKYRQDDWIFVRDRADLYYYP